MCDSRQRRECRDRIRSRTTTEITEFPEFSKLERLEDEGRGEGKHGHARTRVR